MGADCGTVAAVASGGGGEGKPCDLQAIGNHKDTKTRFPGRILYTTIGVDSNRIGLIEQLSEIVKFSGAKCCVRDVLQGNDLGSAVSTAGQWFQNYVCILSIDNIWCGSDITSSVVISLLYIDVHNDSHIAFKRRDVNLHADEVITFGYR